MSAQPVLAPSTRPRLERRRILRLVPPPRPRMARAPFLLLLLGLVGVGMVGLLLLNTGLQNQAFEASQLRQQAAQTSYKQGELAQLVMEAGSTRELTRKATELGMRPNQGIAFIELPDGRISGEPTVADGQYQPSALSKSAEELAKERADKALTRAHERRMEEQKVVLAHRQRVADTRAAEQARSGQAPASAAQPADPELGQPAPVSGQRAPESGLPVPEPESVERAAAQPQIMRGSGDR